MDIYTGHFINELQLKVSDLESKIENIDKHVGSTYVLLSEKSAVIDNAYKCIYELKKKVDDLECKLNNIDHLTKQHNSLLSEIIRNHSFRLMR